MRHIKFIVASLIMAYVMALLEVQIEGASGWAADLPTWRKEVSFPIIGMWGYSGKPLTGYHTYLWIYSFLLPHFAFFFTKWSVKKELYLISFYVLFSTFEGLLWFYVNPAYGWGKFKKGDVSWYNEDWTLGIPTEYWYRFSFAIVIYLLSENIRRFDKYFMKLPLTLRKRIYED